MDTLPLALSAPDLMTALEFNVAIQQPCMTWGAPGGGKSQIMAQLANSLQIGLKDVRAMLMNPVDVNGLPYIRHATDPAEIIAKLQAATSRPGAKMQEIINILKGEGDGIDYMGETVWSRPGILPKVGAGILFFDEINAAGPDVQAALYQPILDRRIGDHILGLGWTIMAAGNRESDRGVVYRMPTPLADRLQHYDLAVKFEPWVIWAEANDIHPLIVAYLKMSMRKYGESDQGCGMLHRFNPKERSFPTPRSWEKVSNAVKAMEDRNLIGTEIERATIAGKVGRDAMVELLEFSVTYREGLTMDAIMLNPDSTKLPVQPAMRCAVAAALARNVKKTNVDRIWQYIERMEPEYQMLFVKTAFRDHAVEVQESRVISRFMSEHADEIG